jgi:serine/threonine-protein kinase
MTDLFQGGDPEAGPSDSLRVVTLLDRGLLEARSIENEPAVQADLYQTLGGIHQVMGNLDLADSLMGLGLDIGRRTLGPGHPDVARRLVALGVLRTDQSRHEEAGALIREGLTTLRKRAATDPATAAGALASLAYLLESEGSYDSAIVVLDEALRLQQSEDVPEKDRASTLTQIANCHFYAGRYSLSDSLNQVVLAMDQRLYGKQHPHVAADLVNLGAIRSEMGDQPGAERYYREALPIYEGWYGREHYETAAVLTMIARSLVTQGRNDEAADLLGHALEIRTRIYGPNSPGVASTLNEVSRLAQSEGRIDEAIAGYSRMAEIYRTAYQGKHHLIGIALANLGGAYTLSGEFALAEASFREAIAMYAATLPADHLYVGIARIKLGRALLRSGRPRDAEEESRAGYELILKQEGSHSAWLTSVRRDLVEEYEALGDAEAARRFRAELLEASD